MPIEEDVRRLDITVNMTSARARNRVPWRFPSASLVATAATSGRPPALATAHPVFEAPTGEVLHHHERMALYLTGVQNLDDVGMAEPDQRAHLSLEPARKLTSRCLLIHDRELHHHIGFKATIRREINPPHASLTDRADDSSSFSNLQSNPVVASGCHGTDLWPDGENVLEAKPISSIAIDLDGETVKKSRRTD